MKILLSLVVCLFTFFVSQAQPDSATNSKGQRPFTVTIRTMDNRKITGNLYDFDDNRVMLTTSTNEPLAISATDIRAISFRDKNAVVKGAVTGFATGALLAVGFQRLINLRNSDPGGKNNIKAGMIVGGASGLAGGLAGAVIKNTFIIRGKTKRYHKLRKVLLRNLQ